MSKIEKLVSRFKEKPKNFTFDELIKLLNHFGYTKKDGRGSRVSFQGKDLIGIFLHKPHPGNILKKYQLDNVYNTLKEQKFL